MNFVGSGVPGVTACPEAPTWNPGLIGSLLIEQGDLSAVERFAQRDEHADAPHQARYYSALLPAAPPGPGQQLAFEVDLDRCSGCKACVAACHALNGLDEHEAWREVGLVVGGGIGPPTALPVLQHVTSSCHHCLDPACLNACPVDAYEKDPATGIVRHLDDQCIGCQYCAMACPYDAPKFHAGKGIVRKCDLCGDRLRAGEAPACVQACPHEAIRIRVVDVSEVRAKAEAGEFLPGAFDPSYTQPTTSYRSSRPHHASEARPPDQHRPRPEHAHVPLVVMLVLTQLSVGGLLVELVVRLALRDGGLGAAPHLPLCGSLGLLGIGASSLHLGRPLYAYRVFLGVGHSWLSREVLAFGLFTALLSAFAGSELIGPDRLGRLATLGDPLLGATVAAGLMGVGSSVMVYHVVRRPFWTARISGMKFAGTTLVLGTAAALASLGASCVGAPGAVPVRARLLLPPIAGALVVLTSAKLWLEGAALRVGSGPIEQTAWLLLGPLKGAEHLRRLLGLGGGIVLPLLAALGVRVADVGLAASASVLALVAALGGEIAERYLFFAAVSRPVMPGGPNR
jgi:Fe-S-cluster-containing dehydrogenase component/DMSO reductase anchor subunit